MFLKSSHILPIDSPPLSPGVIHIVDDKIKAIGDDQLLKNPSEEIIDLGAMVLLPGFVNAHCHLELTGLGSMESNDFVPWIRQVVKNKTQFTDEEKIKGIKKGIQNLLKSGVTTIGDHVSFDTPLEIFTQSPLKGRLFLEVLGIIPEVCQDIYEYFKNLEQSFNSQNFQINISPHSVHAVYPDTLKKIFKEEPPPLSIHLAESDSEEEYFQKRGGELAKLIHNRGITPPHEGPTGLTCLNNLGLPLNKILLIHGNYLSDEDINLIIKNQISIIHCPGSHQFFGHKKFDLKNFLDKKINVAIGTDSLASNTQLDFLSELKLLYQNYPDLPKQTLLRMATLGGAIALKIENQIGSLTPGKQADIIGFKHDNKDRYQTILNAKQCDWMMINGKVIFNPLF